MKFSNVDEKWVKLETISEATEAREILDFACSDKDLKNKLKGFKIKNTPMHLNHNHVCTLTDDMESKEVFLTWCEFKELAEIT